MYPSNVTARWETAAAGREALISAAASSFADLIRLLADLRGSNGCPWDREQSLASLRQYVREEADEVCTAIDSVLEYEARLRAAAGLAAADPSTPEHVDRARNEKKGHTFAHHPHQQDFNPVASAAGAPLPPLTAAQSRELHELYAKVTEELGDLLLQSVFMGDILHCMGGPGVEGAVESIVRKLVRRHPHVYGEAVAVDSAAVLANWERIKLAEQAAEPSTE
jgi:NTP pyrophosphatase (non-canonical NTP hydrolase)